MNKASKEKNAQDNESYLNWSLAMWTAYPATFGLAFIFGYFDSRNRRRLNVAMAASNPV